MSNKKRNKWKGSVNRQMLWWHLVKALKIILCRERKRVLNQWQKSTPAPGVEDEDNNTEDSQIEKSEHDFDFEFDSVLIVETIIFESDSGLKMPI